MTKPEKAVRSIFIALLLAAIAGAAIVSAQSRDENVTFETVEDGVQIEREVDGTQVTTRRNGTVVATRPVNADELDAYYRRNRILTKESAESTLQSVIGTIRAAPSADPATARIETAITAIGELLIEPEIIYPTPTPTTTSTPIPTVGFSTITDDTVTLETGS